MKPIRQLAITEYNSLIKDYEFVVYIYNENQDLLCTLCLGQMLDLGLVTIEEMKNIFKPTIEQTTEVIKTKELTKLSFEDYYKHIEKYVNIISERQSKTWNVKIFLDEEIKKNKFFRFEVKGGV